MEMVPAVPGGGDRGWVLVDAGLPGSAGWAGAAEQRFGPHARPGGGRRGLGDLFPDLSAWPER